MYNSRDAPCGPHRWEDVGAGKHQSDRLLQGELWPSQLEAPYSAIDDQPDCMQLLISLSAFYYPISFQLNFFNLFTKHSSHKHQFISCNYLRFLIFCSIIKLFFSISFLTVDHLRRKPRKSNWRRLQPCQVGLHRIVSHTLSSSLTECKAGSGIM